MYIAILPAANASLILPQSKRKLLPMELSSQRIFCSHSRPALVWSLSP